MNNKKLIVIGGGTSGGAPAAITARMLYDELDATVIDNDQRVLVPCAVPYALSTLKDLDDNLFLPSRYESSGVNFIEDEVVEISRADKRIRTGSGRSLDYDKLILATGSVPIRPPIKGNDKNGVFVANREYVYQREFIERSRDKKRVIIIGGGFVGMEYADELVRSGHDVKVIEQLPHCLQLAFDDEYCMLAEEKAKERGVDILTGRKVVRIFGDRNVEGVELDDGTKIGADMVLMAVGSRKNTALARAAGLEVDEREGIIVNEYQQTSDEDIFAIGDCAIKYSYFTNKPTMLMLASIAAREARICVANLFEGRRKNNGIVGTFSTVIGDTGFSVTGLTEKDATEIGKKYVKAEINGPDKHPPTMPGMRRIKIKMLFDTASEEIIGAQLSGGYVVGELINHLSTMVRNRSTIDDIAALEMGTHPLLTSSPGFYHIAHAANNAKKSILFGHKLNSQ